MINILNYIFKKTLSKEEQEKVNLFKDNSYLSRKEKPEALVFLGLSGNVLNMGQLNEKNAEILKDLASNYNVKLIAATMYPGPHSMDKKYNEKMIASGISEIYFPSVSQKATITPKALKLESFDCPTFKPDAYKLLAKENDIGMDKVFILDMMVLAGSMVADGYAFPQNIAAHPETLLEMVSKALTPR